MGANNFNYENRCIVVTDEDYEDGNVPSTEDNLQNGRNYYQVEVVDRPFQELLKHTVLVLTAGYYSGACLDYIQSDEVGPEKLRKEALIADRILDTIKENYGYKEYNCIGVASNGEGFYEKVGD